ncbi:related to amidohydrolase [Cephalotrichum gorgonifer]|uniref:Peptidase M20 domain-containing protein 2 n=1 Tax=Cephalotrichum gorgonifer TaxID=2041049 RepID=A0AAE8MTS3_9PEZI|nr:related to amidohydrolase [Cephalotrichum gorgonifer]
MDTSLWDDYVLISRDDYSGESEKEATLKEIGVIVGDLEEKLWPVNKKIHDNPELGFKEFIAHDALTNFMRARPGWKVTPSVYGMETAWMAVFDGGKPGPVVSFNAEMDCLPGIGHACGHNLIASASVAGGGGKIRLLEAGAYSDHKVDLNLISHPGIVVDAAMMRTTAYYRFKAEYFGREAHAAANPWLGINALDALVSAYNSISALRQQTMAGDIIQGYITDGGIAPNIIHAYAAGIFVVRADTQARLEKLKEKVKACFEAGALATGAKLVITKDGAYKDHVPNKVLARSYVGYFNALHPPNRIPEDQGIDEMQGRTQASTDQGDISYAMPSLSAGFSITPGPEGQGPHNPEFAVAAGTRDAFSKSMRVAKALAGVAWDIYTCNGLLDEVKREWEKDMKG